MLDVIDLALAEDLGAGDLTTAAVVPEGARAGHDRAAGAGRAGRPGRRGGGVRARGPRALVRGARRRRGLARAGTGGRGRAAPAAAILAAERVALNFLGRLSGVATLTARYVEAVEGTGARILDTRKTTPGPARRSRSRRCSPAAAPTTAPASTTPSSSRRTTRRWPAGWGRPPGARWRRRPAGVTVEVECADARRGRGGAGRGRAGGSCSTTWTPTRLRRAVELVAGRARARGLGRRHARERASGGRDRGRLHQRGRAHPLGPRARPEPAPRPSRAPARLDLRRSHSPPGRELHFDTEKGSKHAAPDDARCGPATHAGEHPGAEERGARARRGAQRRDPCAQLPGARGAGRGATSWATRSASRARRPPRTPT